MAVYKFATESEVNAWHAEAKRWITTQNPSNMFSDMGPASKLAVTEYLANQQGKTIYEGGVGRDIVEEPRHNNNKKKKKNKPEPIKPSSEPIRALRWDDCMAYLEKKYGWYTEGEAYPVALFYEYLSTMGYIPEGNGGLTRINWAPIKETINSGVMDNSFWLGIHHDKFAEHISQEDFINRLRMVIDTTIREFSLDSGNENTYWEF